VGRGRGLPIDDDDAKRRSFEATFTEWDSSIFGVDVHVRTVVTDDYLYTEYQPGSVHDGSEGELYVLGEDPLQRVNRFDDPAMAAVRSTLADRLVAHVRRPGERATPGVLMAPCSGRSVDAMAETVIQGSPIDPVEEFRSWPLPQWQRSEEFGDVIYEVARGSPVSRSIAPRSATPFAPRRSSSFHEPSNSLATTSRSARSS